MDELDLLKKDWNKEEKDNKLSAKDIYPMLLKKSSSIVKTLFYISIAELVFWILINTIPYFTSQNYQDRLDSIYKDEYIFTSLTVFSYIIIAIFIYLLYKTYKSISVTDNAKNLMKNILKTRKIIKYYVLYNLIMVGVSFLFCIYFVLQNDEATISGIKDLGENGLVIYLIIISVFIIFFIIAIWLFYKLLYGLLLKRLNRNYKELKKLEV